MSWWDEGSREFKEWLARLVGNVEHGAINLAADQYGNPINSGLRDISQGANDTLHQIWQNSVYGANKIGSDYQRYVGGPVGSGFGELGNQYNKYVWDPLSKMAGSSEGGTSGGTQPGSASGPKPQVIPQYNKDLWDKQKKADEEKRYIAQTQFEALSKVQIGGVAGTSQVYDGRTKTKPHRPALARPGEEGDFPSRSTDIDKTRDLSDVAQDAFRWSDSEAAKMAKLMVEAGHKEAATGDRQVLANIWSHYAATSALMLQQGNKRTPIELLTRIANGVGGAGSLAGTKTTTDTHVTLTNATSARQLAQVALSTRLGRKATDAEVAEFVGALRAEEKKNPTVTTNTVTRDAQGDVVSSKGTTKEGADPRAFATQYGEDFNSPEADAYQVAGLLMPWFFDALKAPV